MPTAVSRSRSLFMSPDDTLPRPRELLPRSRRGTRFHGPYHDREYGFPIRSDAALLERLALEINQAGLSWLTMLQKRKGFRRAFAGFDVEKVARFGARNAAASRGRRASSATA